MDRRERIDDPEETLRAALDDLMARFWCSLPGIIQSFDATKLTATVQPAIKAKVKAKDGTVTDVSLPLLVDCPVEFPSGGGFTLTFPVAKGDECVIDFADRCIDAWWQSGDVQNQLERRMHDLSDAIVRVGPRSQTRLLSSVSTTKVQLRSDTGETYLEMDKTAHTINLVAPGNVTITGNLTVTGAISAAGEITSTLGATHTLTQHKHGNVTTGAGQTGTPTG